MSDIDPLSEALKALRFYVDRDTARIEAGSGAYGLPSSVKHGETKRMLERLEALPEPKRLPVHGWLYRDGMA